MPEKKVRILIVEDEVIVGLDLCTQLDEEGFDCLGPASRVDEAMQLIENDAPDCALLDANLNGESPRQVAERLAQLNIPFFYISGYGAEDIKKSLPPAPLIEKPVKMNSLISLIHERLEKPAVQEG